MVWTNYDPWNVLSRCCVKTFTILTMKYVIVCGRIKKWKTNRCQKQLANYRPVKDDLFVTYTSWIISYGPRDVYCLIPPFSGFISYRSLGPCMIHQRTWRIHSKAVSTIRGRNLKTELFISTVGPTIQELTVTKTELFISTVGPTIQTNRKENGAFRKRSSESKRRENGAF